MISPLRQRPLLLPFCSFSAGIAAAVTWRLAIPAEFLILLFILSLFLSLIPRTNLPFLITLNLFIFACGNIALQPALDSLRKDRVLLKKYIGSQMLVEGVVIRRPDAREGGVRLQIRPEYVFADDGRITLQGDILLHAGAGDRHLTTGDRVRFTGKLKVPRNFGIPGEFDSERYMAMKRVSPLRSSRTKMNSS